MSNENKCTTKQGAFCIGTEMRALRPYVIYPLPAVALPAQICCGAGVGTETRY